MAKQKLLQTMFDSKEAPETKLKKSGGRLSTDQVEDGKAELSDLDFVTQNANAEDLKKMRAEIESRTATERAEWITLPDGMMIPGDNILFGCPTCHRWLWAKPGLETCSICNGKTVRPASRKETKEWWIRAKAAHKKFLADIPKRKKEVADFNKRHFQDAPKPLIIHDTTIKKG